MTEGQLKLAILRVFCKKKIHSPAGAGDGAGGRGRGDHHHEVQPRQQHQQLPLVDHRLAATRLTMSAITSSFNVTFTGGLNAFEVSP